MKCKACQSEIEEKGTGRESGLSQQARAHMGSCEACRVFGAQRAALRRLLGGLPAVEAPADFDFRLRARLFTAESERKRLARAWSFAPGALSLALAASFVMLIGAAVFLRPSANVEMPNLARNQSIPPPPSSVRSETAAPVETAQPSGATEAAPLGVADEPLETAELERETIEESNGLSGAEQRQLARALERRRASADALASRAAAEAGLPARAFNESAPVLSVPVGHPTQPLQVMMRDEAGASRAVAIEPVSFGAQDMAGRLRQPRRASLPADQGVW